MSPPSCRPPSVASAWGGWVLRRVPWLASHCRSRSTCGVPRACRTPRISARGDGAEPRCHGAWPRSARVSDRPFALRPGPGSPHRLLPRPSCCVRLEERKTRPRRSTSAGDSRGSGGRSRRLPVAPAPATASGAAADRVPCSRSGGQPEGAWEGRPEACEWQDEAWPFPSWDFHHVDVWPSADSGTWFSPAPQPWSYSPPDFGFHGA